MENLTQPLREAIIRENRARSSYVNSSLTEIQTQWKHLLTVVTNQGEAWDSACNEPKWMYSDLKSTLSEANVVINLTMVQATEWMNTLEDDPAFFWFMRRVVWHVCREVRLMCNLVKWKGTDWRQEFLPAVHCAPNHDLNEAVDRLISSSFGLINNISRWESEDDDDASAYEDQQMGLII